MKTLFLAAAIALTSVSAFAAEAVPFIADDYAKARELAAKRNVPIFVEAWAPW
ncbi:MAG TPA: hypothetical protein VF618_11010 [Thermoanaerobaculia bacterium]